jgi:hypothetical protein
MRSRDRWWPASRMVWPRSSAGVFCGG